MSTEAGSQRLLAIFTTKLHRTSIPFAPQPHPTLHTTAKHPPFPSNTSSQNHLTTPDSRTRQGVVSRGRVVDVDQDAGVGGLVGAGQGDLGRGVAVAAARDLELAARNVELRAALAARAVQRNVLDAQQVLAGWQRFGERDEDFFFLCCRRVC